MNPLVSIIILNWNGWQDTLECLESLYQIDYPNYPGENNHRIKILYLPP